VSLSRFSITRAPDALDVAQELGRVAVAAATSKALGTGGTRSALHLRSSSRSTPDGEPMNYERMLEGINALYELAGVAVPVSESGVTMPWHSLRHTFGTECAARGVPVPVIKELMGHASIATTMRYVTVTGDQLDAAIRQAFGQRVGNAPAEKNNAEPAVDI